MLGEDRESLEEQFEVHRRLEKAGSEPSHKRNKKILRQKEEGDLHLFDRFGLEMWSRSCGWRRIRFPLNLNRHHRDFREGSDNGSRGTRLTRRGIDHAFQEIVSTQTVSEEDLWERLERSKCTQQLAAEDQAWVLVAQPLVGVHELLLLLFWRSFR